MSTNIIQKESFRNNICVIVTTIRVQEKQPEERKGLREEQKGLSGQLCPRLSLAIFYYL